MTTSKPTRYSRTAKITFDGAELDTFKTLCSQTTQKQDYPLAQSIQKNIPIFSAPTLLPLLISSEGREEIMAQLHHCLSDGPGVFVITNLISDHTTIDRANSALEEIIRREKENAGGGKGDHFAPGGANDRIWNSFQKHAMVDPESFIEYYANDLLALVCEAWLGPGYQITAQTNIVKPGGKAQQPHRDYHLGFQSESTASKFPTTSQIASSLLTLQLAIAHSPMPLPSGPTQLLPYSHQYTHGYRSYRHPSFAQHFAEKYVQLPLEKGDALFFNPALFHAAGDNVSRDVRRSANLMQVSACWSRAMEVVDRDAILRKTWSSLKRYYRETHGNASTLSNGKANGSNGANGANGVGGAYGVDGDADGDEAVSSGKRNVEAIVKAIGDGYSFPTNLDKDPPPPDGHCPPSHQDLLWKGLEEDWSDEELQRNLDDYLWRHTA